MKKKKSWISTIIIWVVIFVVIILMVNGLQFNGNKPKELDYNSEFLTLAKNTEEGSGSGQKIASIQINYRDVFGLYEGSKVLEEDFKKKPDKVADFHTIIPSENTFRSDMAAIVYAANPDKYKSVDEVSSNEYSFKYESVITQESLWSIILPYLIIFGAFAIFYFLMMRQQMGGKNVMSFGKSKARVQTDDKNKVTFKDVAGADEEKQELKEVVEFMRNPTKFNEMGARIPKGVLLVGPPGTGKTLLAKAVAGEAGVPFFSISGSDFVEMFVGVGASRVRDLFQTAKHATPAVVFIDEIDAVGRHRGAGMGGGHDEREQTLNQLLVEMDGFAPNEGIIVIAATNRPDILDPALLRPGRFDRQITVNYPDIKGREEILKVHARNKPLDSDVSLSLLAKRTPGFTGADLENVLNEGAILAARGNKSKISMEELEEAITRVQMGPEKKSRVVTQADKKLTAYHEAGHAIVAMKLPNCDPVHEVSIIPRGAAGGYTMMLPKEDKNYVTKGKLLDSVAMALGGRAAEKLRMEDISTGAYSDIQNATQVAHKMVAEYGMSDDVGLMYLGGQQEIFIGLEWGQQRNCSESMASKVDTAVQQILKEQYQRAEEAIASDMEAFDRVAAMLMERERVTGEEFAAIYRGEDPAEVFKMESGEQKPQETAAEEPAAAEEEPAAEESVASEETPAAPVDTENTDKTE